MNDVGTSVSRRSSGACDVISICDVCNVVTRGDVGRDSDSDCEPPRVKVRAPLVPFGSRL